MNNVLYTFYTILGGFISGLAGFLSHILVDRTRKKTYLQSLYEEAVNNILIMERYVTSYNGDIFSTTAYEIASREGCLLRLPPKAQKNLWEAYNFIFALKKLNNYSERTKFKKYYSEKAKKQFKSILYFKERKIFANDFELTKENNWIYLPKIKIKFKSLLDTLIIKIYDLKCSQNEIPSPFVIIKTKLTEQEKRRISETRKQEQIPLLEGNLRYLRYECGELVREHHNLLTREHTISVSFPKGYQSSLGITPSFTYSARLEISLFSVHPNKFSNYDYGEMFR